MIRRAEKLAAEKQQQDTAVSFTFFGKKGRDWGRKSQQTMVEDHVGVVGTHFGFDVASTAGRKLVEEFLQGQYDEVHIVYAEFLSMARQLPVVKQLLPIPPIEKVEEVDKEAVGVYLPEHICEPSPEQLLGEMLPRNVYVQIYSALLETSTSEHAARMMAMDNATKACKDMLENLTLVYNKARQAAITAELMDIVGGAEALKG